jgi:hypothetical protein
MNEDFELVLTNPNSLKDNGGHETLFHENQTTVAFIMQKNVWYMENHGGR